MGELSPGATSRRWIPEGGLHKHNEKIHKESKFADDYKNLPFSFSKPPRSKRHEWFECVECGHILSAPKNTVMVECRQCNKATKVERMNYDDNLAYMDDTSTEV